jgi:hypothetical protein
MSIRHLVLLCVLVLLGSASPLASSQSTTTCKLTFSVAYLDRLNNMNVGIPEKSLKDIQKRLGKFGDVCYTTAENSDLVFFIHTTPAVYHGTHIYTNNSSAAAATTDAKGNAAAAAATSTSTTAVLYEVDYSVFILDIEQPQADGKTFKVLQTLDQKSLYHTLYGIGYGKGKHPIPNLIEAGAQWLHSDYLEHGSQAKW